MNTFLTELCERGRETDDTLVQYSSDSLVGRRSQEASEGRRTVRRQIENPVMKGFRRSEERKDGTRTPGLKGSGNILDAGT
jgi:hypothetical protein